MSEHINEFIQEKMNQVEKTQDKVTTCIQCGAPAMSHSNYCSLCQPDFFAATPKGTDGL